MILFSRSEQRAERREPLRENTEQEKGDCLRKANKEWRKKWRLDREERGEYGTGTCHHPSWYFGIFARLSLSPLVHGDLNVRNQHHLKEQSLLLTVLLPPHFALVFALIKLGETIPRSEQKRPSAVSQYGTSCSKEQPWTPAPLIPPAQRPLLRPLRLALLFALNHLY